LYTISGRVGASRTGADSLLRLGSALDLIQDCSYHWMESEPAFMAYLQETGAVMVLVSRQLDVMRLPRYGENVTVSTSIFDCRSFLGRRNTVIYDGDGRPCVLTWSVGAFVDRETGKMMRLTPEVLETVTVDEKVGMDYLDKKITLPEGPWERLEAVPVRRGDIDLNRHMNNARYVDAALELLPEDFEVKRLRIEYKMPAKQGGSLYPRVCALPDGRRFVLLADAAGAPYTVMEFS
jgi:acyl-ACP thioesterase